MKAISKMLAVGLGASAVLVARPAASAVVVEETPPAVVSLSLADAVARARVSAPRLGGLRASQEAAEAALRGARSARAPQLELQATYARNSDVPELVLQGPPPRTIFPNIPDSYRTRVGVALPLYMGGRIGASIDAARGLQDAAGRDLAGAEHDLVLETTSAYWSLVTARESVQVLGEALSAYEAHLADARNRLEQGLAARNEVLAVQVERDRAELARLQAENSAAVANEDLVRLTGLDPGTRVETLDAPADAAEEEALAGEALVTRALEARPELQSLRARLASAEAGVRVARAGSRPQASLSAGYDYANPNNRVLPLSAEWRGTWSVGVSVSWTAFDGGRTSAAVAEAKARSEELRQRLLDAEQRVRLEVTARSLDVSSAQLARQVAERALDAARENLQVAKDRYHEGLIPSAELLDAEAARLRAGLDRTQAAAQLMVAQAGLARAIGG